MEAASKTFFKEHLVSMSLQKTHTQGLAKRSQALNPSLGRLAVNRRLTDLGSAAGCCNIAEEG